MVYGVGYIGVVTVWVLWVDDGYGIRDEWKVVWKRKKNCIKMWRRGDEIAQGKLWVVLGSVPNF